MVLCATERAFIGCNFSNSNSNFQKTLKIRLWHQAFKECPIELKHFIETQAKPTYSITLRSQATDRVAQQKVTSTFGEMTFNNFFSKFLNKLDLLQKLVDFKISFLEFVGNNVHYLYNRFIYFFPRFNIFLNPFFFKVKKQTVP